jgi:hypothetical protein
VQRAARDPGRAGRFLSHRWGFFVLTRPGAQSFGDWLLAMACKDSSDLGVGYEDVLKSGQQLKAKSGAPAKKAAPVCFLICRS